MAREFAREFYKSKEWKGVRAAALMRDGMMCQRCGAVADDVHHIIHLTEDNITDPKITLSLDNLISLCRECHFKEHMLDKANGIRRANGIPECRYVFDENGYLVEYPPGGKNKE